MFISSIIEVQSGFQYSCHGYGVNQSDEFVTRRNRALYVRTLSYNSIDNHDVYGNQITDALLIECVISFVTCAWLSKLCCAMTLETATHERREIQKHKFSKKVDIVTP